MRSFLRNGHKYRLFSYQELLVPEGVQLLDASAILPESDIFFFRGFLGSQENDVGPFSDLFRYKLLMDIGGWYVDVDTLCRTSEIPSTRAWAQENPSVLGDVIVNGAQMYLEKGDPLARILFERCRAIGVTSERREDWGPNLLTKVIVSEMLPLNVTGTSRTFYPIDWIAAFSLVMPKYRTYVIERTSSAWFVAAYQSFFKACGIDLSRTPPRGSYLFNFYNEYAFDKMGSSIYKEDEIVFLVREFFRKNADWAIPQVVRAVGDDVVRMLDL